MRGSPTMSCVDPPSRTGEGLNTRRRTYAAWIARIATGSLAGGGFAAIAAMALWGWPLTTFLLQAVFPGLPRGVFTPSLAPLTRALQGGMAYSLLHSLTVSTLAALMALPAGAWLAWLSARARLWWSGWIDVSVWLLLVLPGYFLASGFMLLAAPIGPLAAWPDLQQAATLLLGPPGIVLVLTLKALPFVFLALKPALAQVSAAPMEAALVHGLRPLQRLHLAAASILPALGAGLAAAFAESLSDFAVAATLGAGSGFMLGTYAIEQAVNAMPLDFPGAAAGAAMLLLLLAPALWLQSRANRARDAARTLGPRHRPTPQRRLTRTASTLHALGAASLAAFALGVPIAAAASLALHGSSHAGAQAGVLRAFAYSLELAIPAATITVALAWPAAAIAGRGGKFGRLLDAAMLGVLALPGVVLASSYVFAYNQPWTPLYGGSGLLAMAYVAVALPATAKVLQGPVTQLHARLAEAASVHGLTRLQRLRYIDAPILAVPLFSAWLLAVLHVAFELPASELLYPAGHPPLAVALLNAAAGFQLHLQARLQLIGIGLLVLFALLARLAFGGFSPRAAPQSRPSVVETA